MWLWIIGIVVVLWILGSLFGGGGGGGSNHYRQPWEGSCFPAGTLIHTPAGCVPIESLKENDSVYCYDYRAKQLVAGQITRVDVGVEPEVRTITFLRGGSITCSPSQRLYGGLGMGWIRSGGVKAKSAVGEFKILKTETKEWGRAVYSFVIQPHDNFVVLTTGGIELIVHDNSSP